MRFSPIVKPTRLERGDVFQARQYHRDAFEGLSSPVLNVDWFEMRGPTFPAHPHAGFSAVTYLFDDSEGGFRNQDSMGADIAIEPGEVHWSKAASGLVHEETPLDVHKPVRGLQIFVNLPRTHQLDEPGAYHVYGSEVEASQNKGVQRRIAVDGTQIGNTKDAIPNPVNLGEILLAPDATYDLIVPGNWGGLLIVLNGKVRLNEDTMLDETQAIGFRAHDNRAVRLSTNTGARIAVIQGEVMDQPVYQRGPLMLADEQVLADRLAAFKRGEFGAIITN